MTASRKLQIVSSQTKELLVKNDVGFKSIQSQIESFHSSQNVSRSSYEIQLANIEGHLSNLQKQLYFDKFTTRKVSNAGERVEAADILSPCSRRKSYVDLRPLGQIVFDYEAAAKRGSRRPSAYRLTYTFIPPAWLSYLILHWDLHVQKMSSRPPRLSFSLSPMRYNPSSELKAAVTRFDTPSLYRLFGEGRAHPTDYIVQRRPITLLEVDPKVPMCLMLSKYSSRRSLHELIDLPMKLLKCIDILSKSVAETTIPSKSQDSKRYNLTLF